MIIGSWGLLVFQVSGNIARTIQELTEKSSGRWAEHEVVNTAPLSEFLGPGLDELDFTIIFTRMLGIEPQLNYEALRLAVRRGEYFPFILGGFPLSGNFWRISEISGTSTVFNPKNGQIAWMECTIKVKEYN